MTYHLTLAVPSMIWFEYPPPARTIISVYLQCRNNVLSLDRRHRTDVFDAQIAAVSTQRLQQHLRPI